MRLDEGAEVVSQLEQLGPLLLVEGDRKAAEAVHRHPALLAHLERHTAAEIDAIASRADTEAWSALDADVLSATDQLLDGYRIDDDTWGRLAQRFDERQLMEVAFIVGTYTCLAMAFNSFGLELDPELGDVTPPLPPDSGT